jgi:hypothetical protein
MSTVTTIACAAQGGLILPPLTNGAGQVEVVTLNGPPAPANGLNVGHGNTGWGLTEVDQAIWAAFSAIYASNPLITSGAVWEVL